jgi:hypothetical protein
MAGRSQGWKVGRAHDLQDSRLAQEFLSSVEEGFSVEVALAAVFRAMDVRRCRWPARTFRVRSTPRHNPTQETLNRLLRPLKLTLGRLEPSN